MQSGDDTGPKVPKLGPKEFADMIKKHPKWPGSNEVVLYSCKQGKGGDKSFAKKLANELGVPVWAPTDNLQYGDKPGQSTGISNGGKWQKFMPH